MPKNPPSIDGPCLEDAEDSPPVGQQSTSSRQKPPAKSHTLSRLLTPNDVAVITGLSTETLAQWRSQGRGIPFVRMSRNRVAYRQADLEKWIDEHVVRVDEQ